MTKEWPDPSKPRPADQDDPRAFSYRYQRSQSRQIAAQLVKQGIDPNKPIPKGTRIGISKRRAKGQRRIAALQAHIGNLRREPRTDLATASAV